MAEKPTELYTLDKIELALVLAGLRMLQQEMIDGGTKYLTPAVQQILDDGEVAEGAIDRIDELCESLNLDGLTFGDVVNLLGDTSTDPYVNAAGQHHLLEEGTLEVEVPTIVSRGEGGAYVMAWLWVDNPS